MARSNVQKRAVKASNGNGTSSSSSSTTSSTIRTTRAEANGIPHPFEPAPDRLQSWLSAYLSTDRLYLTHLDLNPKQLKRQIFIVPVILNLLFAASLLWRVYYIYPWYLQLAHQIWELRNVSSWQNLYNSSKGSVFGLVKQELRNVLTVAIDYVLLLVVAPWPWSFFLEQPGNPISWRRALGGFRERELIVRVSRGWDVNDLLHGGKQASESPFFVTRVFPAVQMQKISKTGYLLMDKDWDLDFWAMARGQKEIDNAGTAATNDATNDADQEGGGTKVVETAFNGKMFAFWKPSATSPESSGRWVMWDFRRDLYEKDKPATVDGLKAGSQEVDEGRRAIERFEAKLAEMGKEELFFKWVELIHYESSKPGGFTKERQIEAGAKIKQLFEHYEVDFEKFERDCGIVDGRIVD